MRWVVIFHAVSCKGFCKDLGREPPDVEAKTSRWSGHGMTPKGDKSFTLQVPPCLHGKNLGLGLAGRQSPIIATSNARSYS